MYDFVSALATEPLAADLYWMLSTVCDLICCYRFISGIPLPPGHSPVFLSVLKATIIFSRVQVLVIVYLLSTSLRILGLVTDKLFLCTISLVMHVQITIFLRQLQILLPDPAFLFVSIGPRTQSFAKNDMKG